MDVTNNVKYPQIKVKLTGMNGNAFVILGLVEEALKKGKVSKEGIDTFIAEATSGDYNHLLQTCLKTVNCV